MLCSVKFFVRLTFTKVVVRLQEIRHESSPPHIKSPIDRQRPRACQNEQPVLSDSDAADHSVFPNSHLDSHLLRDEKLFTSVHGPVSYATLLG